MELCQGLWRMSTLQYAGFSQGIKTTVTLQPDVILFIIDLNILLKANYYLSIPLTAPYFPVNPQKKLAQFYRGSFFVSRAIIPSRLTSKSIQTCILQWICYEQSITA